MRAWLSLVAVTLALGVAGAQVPSRVFAVVFDDATLSSGGLRRLQAAASALFTNEFHPGDLGGVVVDGNLIGSRLLSDRDELLKAVARAHPRIATASDLESATQVIGGVEQSSRLAEIQNLDVARAALDRKLSIVETLVSNLARVEGAKAVLLASEAFGGDGTVARIAAIGEAAMRAHVRFYVFDESGNDRDAAGGLARLTGGQTTRKANEFAPAIAAIGKTTVVAPSATATPANAGAGSSPAAPPAGVAFPAGTATAAAEPGTVTNGVVVAAPSAASNVLRVRPLMDTNVMDLVGSDWSEAGARAGWEAYQRGDLESARTALAPIASRATAPSWVRYVLGLSDYALGNFKEAADAWERVRARQPQYEPVYLDLADDYVKLNQRRKAIDVLRVAQKRWPRDPDVWNALGVFQAAGGDLDAAAKTLREGLVALPNDLTLHLNLAKALEMIYMKKRRESQLLQWRMGAAEGKLYQEALSEYRTYLAGNGAYADIAREGLDRLEAARPNLRPR